MAYTVKLLYKHEMACIYIHTSTFTGFFFLFFYFLEWLILLYKHFYFHMFLNAIMLKSRTALTMVLKVDPSNQTLIKVSKALYFDLETNAL